MRYAVLGGGKRLRPLLCLASAATRSREHAALPAAVAVELIHCYSLVHDDLPALDNDALRRGQPATHAKFGEALAIVAGDALQALAFGHLSRTGDADAAAVLAEAAGASGMCLGQAGDLAGGAASEAALRSMHERKTGALIAAAVALGARAAGLPAGEQRKLAAFAGAFGLMFQIADDIADATASAADTGKSAGKDRQQGKATYATVLGLAAARRRHASAHARAARALASASGRTDNLAALMRDYAPQAA